MIDEQILEDILLSHKSLSEPNWSFVLTRANKDTHRSTIDAIGSLCSVVDTTDINYDRGVMLAIEETSPQIAINLSFAGRYACVYGFHGEFYSLSDLGNLPLGSQLIGILERERFRILDQEQLTQRIILGEKSRTLYQVLFSDDGYDEDDDG